MTGPVVFLDACVLFPALVREIVLGAAARGLFRPRWSARVLDEWLIAIARRHGSAAEDGVRTARSRMQARFPDALLPPRPDLEEHLHLPDPADAHVAAAAAPADILLTFNLRDFPARTMSGLAVDVRHPDGFLWELWSHAPEAVEAAVGDGLNTVGIALDDRRAALKRARLSRLGKALAQGGRLDATRASNPRNP